MRSRLVAIGSGIGAVGAKELRGRMRGSRAFIGLTVYLAVLAAVALVVYTAQRDAMGSQSAFGGGNPYVSAQVGQALFATQLFLQVLLIVFLAPAATAGAISLEREKQTLEMLTATPISTVGIVVGKLAAALAFVVVLIVGSIPLTALVFLFGGVAPEDVVRGYLVLFATAIGFGCVGLLMSSLTRRTQTATVLTYLAVLLLTVGTGSGLILEFALYGAPRTTQVQMVDDVWPGGEIPPAGETTGHAVPWPPDFLVLLNPVVAAADVICGTDTNPYSNTCLTIAAVTGTSPGNSTNVGPPPVKGWGGAVEPGVAVDVPPDRVVEGAGGANDDRVGFDATAATSTTTRDTFWPRSAGAWLIVSLVLVLVAIQLVSPTRRWRLFRLRLRREAKP